MPERSTVMRYALSVRRLTEAKMIEDTLRSAKKMWDSYKVRNDPDFRRAADRIKARYNHE